MNNFSPLDGDVRNKNLVYVSSAKLKNLLLDTNSRGMSIGFSGAQIGRDSITVAPREEIYRAYRFLQNNNLISYEIPAEGCDWLLVRAIAICGNAWPWSGHDSDYSQVAWWVGESEHLDLLAYGNRKHLLNQGEVPNVLDTKNVAYWWPSNDSGYTELLKSISISSRDESENSAAEHIGHEQSLRDFRSNFFNSGVSERKGHYPPYHKRGLYEILLRVDNVEANDETGKPTVFGSPLWVSKPKRPVPAIYNLENLSENIKGTLQAYWDGNRWTDAWINDPTTNGRFSISNPKESNSTIGDFDGIPTLATISSLRPPESVSELTCKGNDPNKEHWFRNVLRKIGISGTS